MGNNFTNKELNAVVFCSRFVVAEFELVEGKKNAVRLETSTAG